MTAASPHTRVPFAKALMDRTAGQQKVLRREYLTTGSLPVVDQGGELIAGYTNDQGCRYSGSLPVLLFGDHTRIVKYVDFPFALGADGVKVLEPSELYEPRFLYYYLLTQEIPSRGYSRHFQFLREIDFPPVPRSEQRRIVEILDQADRIRRLRAEANAKAERILPALFIKMFGDPGTNPVGWPVRPLSEIASTTSGGTPSTREGGYYGGGIPWVQSGELSQRYVRSTSKTLTTKGLENSSAKWCEPGSVLVAMYGATVGQVSVLTIRATTNQAVCSITPGPAMDNLYLAEFLRLRKSELLSKRVGGAQPNISQHIIRGISVPVPPLELQQRFASSVRTVDGLSHSREESGKGLQALMSRLVSSAFTGSLTSRWREAHATGVDSHGTVAAEADKAVS